jgi:hypothetical protein
MTLVSRLRLGKKDKAWFARLFYSLFIKMKPLEKKSYCLPYMQCGLPDG